MPEPRLAILSTGSLSYEALSAARALAEEGVASIVLHVPTVKPLDEEAVVERLATSCGHWGSGADYLYNTVKNLEQRGIHDHQLWRLQQLVAERIAASPR